MERRKKKERNSLSQELPGLWVVPGGHAAPPAAVPGMAVGSQQLLLGWRVCEPLKNPSPLTHTLCTSSQLPAQHTPSLSIYPLGQKSKNSTGRSVTVVDTDDLRGSLCPQLPGVRILRLLEGKFTTFCWEEEILHLAFLPRSSTGCKNCSNAECCCTASGNAELPQTGAGRLWAQSGLRKAQLQSAGNVSVSKSAKQQNPGWC